MCTEAWPACKLLLLVSNWGKTRQKILNINRSCIIKTNLLLLISYKLIFKFAHKKDSTANNLSNFSHLKIELLCSKPLLVKNILKWRKTFFPQNLHLVLSVIQFITLFFKFRKNSSLSTIWCFFSYKAIPTGFINMIFLTDGKVC